MPRYIFRNSQVRYWSEAYLFCSPEWVLARGAKAREVTVLVVKISLLIPHLFIFLNLFGSPLPKDGSAILKAPLSSLLFYLCLSSDIRRPHDVPGLHESYRIPPRTTCTSFFLLFKEFQNSIPISVTIHISPPPCMLPTDCQGMYGSESSTSFNNSKVGLGPQCISAMLV